MAEPSACVKMEIDTSKYSSYVPVIGVYIAGGSLVCFLAMLYDILSIFRHKKMWIPCKLFSLNSLTLTLLAIAAKIPADLTSPMPSALDQVSKLSGNSLVCISMGFFMPSLGLKKKHDCLTNMLALSIFVVTLIVNTCVQIHTGVIFLFKTQHIITMSCMFAMLYPLWVSFLVVANQQDYSPEYCRRLVNDSPEDCRRFVKEDSSVNRRNLLKTLKKAYQRSFKNTPKAMVYALSRNLENYTVVGLCIISVISLMQPAIKNFSLEICRGSSDYGRSVWIIVLAQILTVLAGSLAIIIRASGLSRHLKRSVSPKIMIMKVLGILFPIKLKNKLKENKTMLVRYVLELVWNCVSWLVHGLVCLAVGIVFAGFGLLLKSNRNYPMDETWDIKLVEKWAKICDIKELLDPGASLGARSVHELMMMIERSTDSRYVSMFLGATKRSVDDDDVHDLLNTIQASYQSMMILVEIAQILLPRGLDHYLWKAALEACELLRIYISKPSIPIYHSPSEYMDVEQFLWKLKSELESDKGLERTEAQREAVGIIDFIANRYGYIKSREGHPDSDRSLLIGLLLRMLIFMSRMCVKELPDLVHKSVMGSKDEVLLELLKTSVEVLYRIEWLEDNHASVFPEGINVDALITAGREGYCFVRRFRCRSLC